jgi:site-specific DNA recombinase
MSGSACTCAGPQTTSTSRYLAAFENGTLDPEDLACRRAALNARTRQLTARRDELASQLDAEPVVPPSATLIEVADHIDEVIASGTHSQRKALIEALVAQVKITGPGRVVPVFRIPQATCTEPSVTSGKVSGVRAMTNLVGLMDQHPNRAPGLAAAGAEILIRPVRMREVS